MRGIFHDLLTRCMVLLLFLPFAGYALLRTKGASRRFYLLLLLIAGLFLLDQLCYEVPPVGFFGKLTWPWQGKLLSIGWALGFIFLSKDTPADYGIRLRFNTGSAGIAWLFILAWPALMFVQARFFQPKSGGNAETLVYFLTMPGLAEELVFRGVFLGLLNKLFPKNWVMLRAEVGWGLLLVTILFALAHAVVIGQGGNILFQRQTFLTVFAGGLILGILRERTGSLIPGMVCHNLWNTAIYLAGVI